MFIYPRNYLLLGCLVIVWLIIATSSTFALDLPPVDPDSDTDNTVNQFLLDEVRQGRTKTIAGGGWWGPPDRFTTNSHDAPCTPYGLRRTFLVGKKWTTLEIPFRAKNFDGITNDARFRLRPIRGAIRIASVHFSTPGDAINPSNEDETALQLAASVGASVEGRLAAASATAEVAVNVADGAYQFFLPLVANR